MLRDSMIGCLAAAGCRLKVGSHLGICKLLQSVSITQHGCDQRAELIQPRILCAVCLSHQAVQRLVAVAPLYIMSSKQGEQAADWRWLSAARPAERRCSGGGALAPPPQDELWPRGGRYVLAKASRLVRQRRDALL